MAVIPKSDINLATHIRDVLNAAGGSVTNEAITFFQADAKINKWSKNKPYDYPVNFDITEEQKQSINYGFVNIPAFTKATYMFNFMLGSTAAQDEPSCGFKDEYYTYQLPRGGSESPYRLGDFAGYDTDATNPLGNISSLVYEVDNGDNDVNLVWLNTQQANSVSIYNIMGDKVIGENATVNTSQLYLGVGLINSSRKIWMTQSSKLEDGSLNPNFTLNGVNPTMAGTYTAFLFLSSIPFTTTQNGLANDDFGVFIPLTFTAATVTVKKVELPIIASMVAYRLSDEPGYIFMDITVNNIGTSGFTISDYSARIYQDSTIMTTTTGVINQTVGAGSSKTIPIQVFVNNYQNANMAEVTLYVDGNTVNVDRTVINDR